MCLPLLIIEICCLNFLETIAHQDMFEELFTNKNSLEAINCKGRNAGHNRVKIDEIPVKLESHPNSTELKMPMIKSENLDTDGMTDLKPTFGLEAGPKYSAEMIVPKTENDQQKSQNIINNEQIGEIELLKRFHLMRKELRHENFYKHLSGFKFESEIANQLGSSRHKIYQLKRKFGQIRVRKTEKSDCDEEIKFKKIQKFDKMRKRYKQICENKLKIEQKIAEKLGISRKKVYQWKREIDIYFIYP